MTTVERRRVAILTILKKMTVGSTTTVFDRVVTRWARDAYEVDTWGKATFSAVAIAFTVAGEYD